MLRSNHLDDGRAVAREDGDAPLAAERAAQGERDLRGLLRQVVVGGARGRAALHHRQGRAVLALRVQEDLPHVHRGRVLGGRRGFTVQDRLVQQAAKVRGDARDALQQARLLLLLLVRCEFVAVVLVQLLRPSARGLPHLGRRSRRAERGRQARSRVFAEKRERTREKGCLQRSCCKLCVCCWCGAGVASSCTLTCGRTHRRGQARCARIINRNKRNAVM